MVSRELYKGFIALFVSDLHGGFIKEPEIIQKKPDVIFFLGDNGETMVRTILDLYPGVPAYGVAGNHDGPTPYTNTRVIELHGQVVNVHGFNVAGLGGCIRYKGAKMKWLFTEAEAREVLLSIGKVDIIISHSQPATKNGRYYNTGLKDDSPYPEAHRGFIELGKYIERHHPLAVFHGHLHKCQDYFHNSTLVKGFYGIEEVYFERNPSGLKVQYTTTKVLRQENFEQKQSNHYSYIRTHIEERLKRLARQIRWWPSPPGT